MTEDHSDLTGSGPAPTTGRLNEALPIEGETADRRQFVTFISGDQVFAVDMVPVKEIIRVPEVVRVPLAPSTLDGLANLRGKVLPIISLRRVFGFAEKPHDDATRALVIQIGQSLGFVVDRVASVVDVEAEKIEGVGSLQGTVDSELLSGVIRDVGGHQMIMVLDFARLIASQFPAVESLSKNPTSSAQASVEASPLDEQIGDELQLVSFSVADQEYALTIDEVEEIVQVPSTIVRVPRSDSHVIGLMTLRSRLLPLVSLRHMLELASKDINEQSRIVVVCAGGASVGIVVDRVNEVLRVARSDLDDLPGLLKREQTGDEISGICRLNGGQRLVSIISARNLFRNSTIREALTTMTNENAKEEVAATIEPDTADDDEQVVVFLLNKEEFGVPIKSVQEIVRVPEELTHVPKAPGYVEGLINLRGAVLPVIDLRQRLGLARLPRADGQRIMVFLIRGLRTGFIVDSVAEVLKIPRSAIVATPRFAGEQGDLLSRMANLDGEKRMVQLLSPEYLTVDEELLDLVEASV
jgi:purine-binding chemotaxis protein CheW